MWSCRELSQAFAGRVTISRTSASRAVRFALGGAVASGAVDLSMTAPNGVLRTQRLDLVATTIEHIDVELQNPHALATLLGVIVPPNWPPGEYDRDALEFFRAQLLAGGPPSVGWYGWYAMTRDADGERDVLVAGAGYLGAPVEGVVEIGYSVVPEARGKGIAGELVDVLVANAFAHSEVRKVVAHTTDANAASTRVLLRCGFQRIGPGSEPESVEYARARPDAG